MEKVLQVFVSIRLQAVANFTGSQGVSVINIPGGKFS
jgi:hypothetical protein